MKRPSFAAILLGVSFIGMAVLFAANADGGSDAEINEPISVYIPVEGTSKLLAKGTPAHVLSVVGGNAVVSLTLESGSSVETEIETKYLKILPPKQNSFAGPHVSPPIRKTAVFNIEEMQVYNPQTDLQDDDQANLQEGIKALVNGHSALVPQIKIVVKTSKDFQSKNLFARAYFFDGSNRMIQADTQPSLVSHAIGGDFLGSADPYIWPPILSQNQRQPIYFPLPTNLPKGWKVVIVFGTNKGAISTVFPGGNEQDFKYPDQQLVEKTALDPYQEIADTDPLPAETPAEKPGQAAALKDDSGPPPLLSSDGHKIVSQAIANNVPGLPVMTFYVRYPKGLSPKDKVEGVFLDVTWLTEKKNLEAWIKRPSGEDENFQFADQHKLAIVTWTTATMYSIADSFTDDPADEHDPNGLMENCFRTWKVGMDRLCRDYGLPDNGFLIYGASRGAQWAHRIVMRSPEKFLAIHIHINSSYAEPVPEASHCLWLLTTGELEHGNKAARVFFHKAQALNYPIMLRIYPGRGHEVFPEEVNLGIKFFEYVLELKDEQLKALAAQQKAGTQPESTDQPFILDDAYLEAFRKPPFFGDLLNGDAYPATGSTLIPEPNLVNIPDVDIAQAWGYFHP